MQGLSQQFLLNAVDPASGQGLPTARMAVSGAAWLGPGPRAALARPGVKTRVPVGWVGPEDSELVDPLPLADR
eukprot:15449792-Alexandrium_andersonii.AAC.1